MVELNENQTQSVCGSGIPFGVVVAALVVGFVTGGPGGLGIAAAGLIVNEGATKLHTLATTGEIT